MKIFFEEYDWDYESYSFGYKIWATREPRDKLWQIYERGFLPYSGAEGKENLLYMARGLRVNLIDFVPNSENRRVLKKGNFNFARRVVPIEKFDVTDEQFLKFCNNYFRERHGIDILENRKLENILYSGFLSHIVIYTDKDENTTAFVFLVLDEKICHYWFSFYDLKYIQQYLGLWLMLNEILEAQKDSKEYMYLGTCYGEKGLYKMNFDYIEWWDGNNWSKDIKLLKEKVYLETSSKNLG